MRERCRRHDAGIQSATAVCLALAAASIALVYICGTIRPWVPPLQRCAIMIEELRVGTVPLPAAAAPDAGYGTASGTEPGVEASLPRRRPPDRAEVGHRRATAGSGVPRPVQGGLQADPGALHRQLDLGPHDERVPPAGAVAVLQVEDAGDEVAGEAVRPRPQRSPPPVSSPFFVRCAPPACGLLTSLGRAAVSSTTNASLALPASRWESQLAVLDASAVELELSAAPEVRDAAVGDCGAPAAAMSPALTRGDSAIARHRPKSHRRCGFAPSRPLAGATGRL